jgi:hypothetical protein
MTMSNRQSEMAADRIDFMIYDAVSRIGRVLTGVRGTRQAYSVARHPFPICRLRLSRGPIG